VIGIESSGAVSVGRGTAIPFRGPEDSRELSFLDFMTVGS